MILSVSPLLRVASLPKSPVDHSLPAVPDFALPDVIKIPLRTVPSLFIAKSTVEEFVVDFEVEVPAVHCGLVEFE